MFLFIKKKTFFLLKKKFFNVRAIGEEVLEIKDINFDITTLKTFKISYTYE